MVHAANGIGQVQAGMKASLPVNSSPTKSLPSGVVQIEGREGWLWGSTRRHAPLLQGKLKAIALSSKSAEPKLAFNHAGRTAS